MSSIVTRVFGLDEFGRPVGDVQAPESDPELRAVTRRNATEPVILFLTANPDKTTALQLPREMQEIRRRLRQTEHGRQFRLEYEPAAVFMDLPLYLADATPTVLHFSGHGLIEGIALEDEQGAARLVSNEALWKLFGQPDITVNLRLVVLNSCYSAAQANAIGKHIDCVVGMTNRIPDKSARAFSRGLYTGLGSGLSVAAAFELAQAQIEVEALDGADLPVLLTREGTDARQLHPLVARGEQPIDASAAAAAKPAAHAAPTGLTQIGNMSWQWQGFLPGSSDLVFDAVDQALRRAGARKVQIRSRTVIVGRMGGFLPGAIDATEELTVALNPAGEVTHATISSRTIQRQISDAGRNEGHIRQLLALVGVAER